MSLPACGHPAKKLRSGPPNPGEKNKPFGTDMPRRRPRKNFGLKKLRADFRSRKRAHRILTHKLFLPPFVPRDCPWDKLGLSQGQTGLPLCKTRRNLGLSVGQTHFVPGKKPACHWDNPGVVPKGNRPKNLCVCAFFLPEMGAC